MRAVWRRSLGSSERGGHALRLADGRRLISGAQRQPVRQQHPSSDSFPYQAELSNMFQEIDAYRATVRQLDGNALHSTRKMPDPPYMPKFKDDAEPSSSQAGSSSVHSSLKRRRAFNFRILCVDGSEERGTFEVMSLRKFYHFVTEQLPKGRYRQEVLLFALRWIQLNIKDIEDDIESPSEGLEGDLVSSVRASAKYAHLRKMLMTTKEVPLPVSSKVDSIISTMLHLESTFNIEDTTLHQAIHSLARHAHWDQQWKTLTAISQRLKPLFSAKTPLASTDYAIEAFAYGTSAHGYANNWRAIWEMRGFLLNAAARKDPNRNALLHNDARPEMLALKAATLDRTVIAKKQPYRHGEKAEAREAPRPERMYFHRLRTVHHMMLLKGATVDTRFAARLIGALAKNLSPILRHDNADNERLLKSLSAPDIAATRRLFFDQLHRLVSPAAGNEGLLYSILDIEIHLANSFLSVMKRPHFKKAELQEEMRKHLEWIESIASIVSDRLRDAPLQKFQSDRQRAYWSQSMRGSIIKAKYATVRLHLVSNDIQSALTTLTEMFDFLENDRLRPLDETDRTSVGLRKKQGIYRFVRSTIVSIAQALWTDAVRDMSKERRRGAIALVELLPRSLDLGVWDVAKGDPASISELSISKKQGPAYELAFLCMRMLGALSPAQSRGSTAWHGPSYEQLKNVSDIDSHCRHYMQLVRLVAQIRKHGLQRIERHEELGIYPQPLHGAFRALISDEPMRLSRIFWSLTARWAKAETRISPKMVKQDRVKYPEIEKLSKECCDDLEWLLEEYVVGFGIQQKAKRTVLTSLRQHVRYIPYDKHKKKALQVIDTIFPAPKPESPSEDHTTDSVL